MFQPDVTQATLDSENTYAPSSFGMCIEDSILIIPYGYYTHVTWYEDGIYNHILRDAAGRWCTSNYINVRDICAARLEYAFLRHLARLSTVTKAQATLKADNEQYP